MYKPNTLGERVRWAAILSLLWTLNLAALASFVLALLILGWQVFKWLKSGEWIPASVIDALVKIRSWLIDSDADWTNFDYWLLLPTTWIGLHKALAFTHVSIVLVALAFALVVFARDYEKMWAEHFGLLVKPRQLQGE